MDIKAIIKKVNYTPILCRRLDCIDYSDLETALSEQSSFILRIDDQNQIAVSRWVSAKRTRSYPYARVYDTLSFTGKKITIIPVFKDEGKDGDRDFLQWDTISLMSLLGIYVIVAYYSSARKNPHYSNKITEQKFDLSYINNKIQELLSFQSDALHWNLIQAEHIGEVANSALSCYEEMSRLLHVRMHTSRSIRNKISLIETGALEFKELSRSNAERAQLRESITIQPKEVVNCNEKATITITNYLGGAYYFTTDEARINGNCIDLVECKHSANRGLPSVEDIKDGLLKMVLFVNLEQVEVDRKYFTPVPILKLTSNSGLSHSIYDPLLRQLSNEAKLNGFHISFE